MTKVLALVGNLMAEVEINPAIIGEIKPWALDTIPTGWVRCDGAIYTFADYPEAGPLFGATYGGDGATTFGVPDLRGRTLRGAGGALSLGDTGGADSITLTEDQLPAHTHDLTGGTVTPTVQVAGTSSNPVNTPNDTNKYLGASGIGQAAAAIWSDALNSPVAMGGVGGSLSGDTGATGAGAAIDITPAYAAVHFIVALIGTSP